jgi:uncharacterized protein (DUF1015 family)
MVTTPPEPRPATRAGPRPPLVLAPFRGLRFDPAAVGDLGTVISPPYDVLDADTVRELEAGNRRNIVRLILARRFERPYLAVRKRLESWRAKAYLVADDTPALYLYQYTVGGTTVRGLIGLVGLRRESDGVVLPHEDVMPGPVEDRTVLMRTTETNPEPILLVHQGSAGLRGLLESASRTPPLADFAAPDGSHHRLWAVTDTTTLDRVADELAPGQALIADGHHRYAAYLELQGERRAPEAPPGSSPWDYGLAMLVDQNDYPLTVGPIHRSVSAMTISDVQELADERGDELIACPDRESAFTLAGAGESSTGDVAHFVISDGKAWAVLVTRRRHAVDAAVLHEELLPAWNVTEEQIGYHHSIDQALQTTARQPGIVVAVHPPALDQVMATAARGHRLPRKSTSFAPKPRMGVVLRDLRDA